MTDPRYDEQFRRGYDGPPVPPSVPPPATTAPTAPAAPARRAEPPAAPLENPTSDSPADENARIVGVVTDQEPEPLRRRNPWSIALLVVGLVMLVLGGWLVRAYATTVAINGYSPGEQLTAFLQQQLSPALLISGFIAVIAWLVLGALTVKPRR